MPIKKASPSTDRKRFGQKVAFLRNKVGLTQEKLAEVAGTSPRYVQALESGEYWPSLPALRKLQAALGCDWKTLCED